MSKKIDDESLGDITTDAPDLPEVIEHDPATFDVAAFVAGVRGTRLRVKIQPNAHLLARLQEIADEIGVTARRSRVCFSRSLLIVPAVEAGARTRTMRVWRNMRATKMPRPMLAAWYVGSKAKLFRADSSRIRPTIQAKPATSRT